MCHHNGLLFFFFFWAMISWTCFGSKLFWLPPCQAEPTGHGVIRHWTLVLRALTVCVPCLVRLLADCAGDTSPCPFSAPWVRSACQTLVPVSVRIVRYKLLGQSECQISNPVCVRSHLKMVCVTGIQQHLRVSRGRHGKRLVLTQSRSF